VVGRESAKRKTGKKEGRKKEPKTKTGTD
jgi:hypothetical protein